MAEATESLRLTQRRASMSMATRVLAQQAALKATKRQMQAQGEKVSQFPMRDLKLRAETYLAEHREELITEAREIVSRWEAAGYFNRGRRSS
jgi:hypothetical protein